ncbi:MULTISPECIES: AAA family ATPase [Paenibacillus]|uniref:AAA family ATPase n=1 Tax=Paenibacillus TaxID=44249 RepID=UPI001BB035EA
MELSVAEINLRDENGGEKTLTPLLEPMKANYDYIIIDTTPFTWLTQYQCFGSTQLLRSL